MHHMIKLTICNTVIIGMFYLFIHYLHVCVYVYLLSCALNVYWLNSTDLWVYYLTEHCSESICN